MFERVRTTVLEGDDATGYQVAFVFREVAATMLSTESRTEIYRKVAAFLCRPKGRVIDSARTLDGIWYAIPGGDLPLALFWAYLLLPVFNQPLTETQRDYMLDRLMIVTALNPSAQSGLRPLYLAFLGCLANVYSEAGNQTRSIEPRQENSRKSLGRRRYA